MGTSTSKRANWCRCGYIDGVDILISFSRGSISYFLDYP